MIVWKFGNRWIVIAVMVLDLFVGLQGVFLAFVTSSFFAAATGKNMRLFLMTAAWATIGFVVISFFNYIHISLKNYLVRITNLNIKNRVTNGLVFAKAVSNSSGESISKISNDLKLLETNGINNELLIIEQLYTVVLAIAAGFYFDPWTTIVFALGSLAPLLISKVYQKPLKRRSQQWSDSNGSYVAELNDFFSGLPTLRLYFARKMAVDRLDKRATKLELALNKMNDLVGHVGVITTLAALVIGVVLPFGFGIYRVIQNILTLAAFMGIVQLSNSIINPLIRIISEINAIQTTNSIKEAIPKSIPAKETTVLTSQTPFNRLQFVNVTLAHDKKTIMTDFNLEVAKGEKVLIKAPSGFGKSTILHAILGDDLIKKGSYLVNGKACKSKEALQLCSLINQSPYMFNDSIRFNITLGQSYTSKQIHDTIKKAQLTELVNDKGLDYQAGEHGVNLSGGQIQRIEIARALIRQRPVILADEITSALDEKLSDEIHDLILSLPEKVIEVAHHISAETEKQYDRVIKLG